MVGGVVRAEFAERAVWWSSGLLDPEVRLVGLLQSSARGQGGGIATGVRVIGGNGAYRRRREALHGGAKRSEGRRRPRVAARV